MTRIDVKECRKWSAFYRSRGFNPLPSRPDAKRPMLLSYAELWEKPLAADEFDRHETSNLQVVCGRRWGLLVVDLDGPEAVERWTGLGWTPDTWISHSGGGGRHVWFTIPTEGPPIAKALLWRGAGDHSAIERLGDKSLVMAPPSIHPRTGRRYRWLDKRLSPLAIPMPALCPPWVLKLAPVRPAAVALQATESRVVMTPGRASGPRLPWKDVVVRLDVPALVRSWGVRTTGRERNGWAECHAIDRPDAKPSAAVHVESGTYYDLGSGLKLGLFDLAVAMGAYGTAREAFDDLRGG